MVVGFFLRLGLGFGVVKFGIVVDVWGRGELSYCAV